MSEKFEEVIALQVQALERTMEAYRTVDGKLLLDDIKIDNVCNLRDNLKAVLNDKELIEGLEKEYTFGPVKCKFILDGCIQLFFWVDDTQLYQFMLAAYGSHFSNLECYSFYRNCIVAHNYHLCSNEELRKDAVTGEDFLCKDLKSTIKVFKEQKELLSKLFTVFGEMQTGLLRELRRKL